MHLKEMVKRGKTLALSGDPERYYWFGAVGVRKDGIIVNSRNGRTRIPNSCVHAETRLLKKLGKDAPLVVVVRVYKNGSLAMSKPCSNCERVLRLYRVKKVMYSTEGGMKSLW